MKVSGIAIALVVFGFGVLNSAALAAAPSMSATNDWLIKTWETEDGLPENSATAMVQTPDGFLWFGTFKGLVRFDGVQFIVFDRSNTPELPSDGIVNLHLDHAGRMWISTLSGLVLREGADWHLRKLQIPVNDYIRTFTGRHNGDLLLTTFSGRIFEYSHERLTELAPPPSDLKRGYLGGVDEQGNWLVAQSKFVGRWSSNRWESVVADNDLAKVTASTLGFTSARDGGFWLLLNSELRKYSHGVEVSRRQLPTVPGQFWSMTEDSQANVWICTTDHGICVVSSNNEVCWLDEPNGVSYHGTRFVFEDFEKNLWIGTSGGGLQRFKSRRFRSFGSDSGLSERVVKSLSPALDGGVWIATYGQGLFRWTASGIIHVPLAETNNRSYGQAVLSDRSGRTWIGTYGPGLFVLDKYGTRHIPVEQSGGNNVIALFEDSAGRIWISGGRKISVFNAGAFHVYGPEDLPISNVCCFGEDSNHAVWLSNQERVFRLENEHFVEVQDANSKPIHGVTCFKGQGDGSMWMGSLGAGLLRWRKGTLATIGTEAGLPVPNVHAILADDQGFFWMPSNKGVMRVKRSDLESVADGTANRLVAQLLDRNDGLADVACPSGQQPTCTRDPDGKLWFATIKGVAITDPASFHPNAVPPLAKIEEVRFRVTTPGSRPGNQGTRSFKTPFPEKLELPAGSHGIEIHYTAPSFTSPEKVRFQVSMDAAAVADWQPAGNRRLAYFDELRPGSHAFRVRAANDDGLWNQTGDTLILTILPFYWQTSLFRVLIVAGACGAGLVWGLRLKLKLDRQRATQEALTRQLILSQENERKRVASELHDGLGQDLLIIKNRLGMLAEGNKHIPEVMRQLLEITDTTSAAIADVRSISHALRPGALEQVGLTRAIEWMVEQLADAARSKFSSELENIDGLLTPDMEINLYRIVQEALNNAVKHAEATEVVVQVRREQHGNIEVSVFDNGKGFDPAHPDLNGDRQAGFGLTGMFERAKVLRSRLEIKSTPGIGTRLTLHVEATKGGTQANGYKDKSIYR